MVIEDIELKNQDFQSLNLIKEFSSKNLSFVFMDLFFNMTLFVRLLRLVRLLFYSE